jgi:ferredoxin
MSGDRGTLGVEVARRAANLFSVKRRPAMPPEAEAPALRPSAPDEGGVRGEPALRLLERGFLYFDRLLGRALPEPLNPFLQTGAVAITSIAVATITGIVLLIWYRPSLHLAYDSVAAMSQAPWTAGLMRSLHRYSSDACMFFALVHALRLFLERRFAGPRWLAWVTGIATVGILWFVGWTGYWLVWDARAQQVAVGTARVLDVVPIFADPMGRSFLTDESVNSLLFFVVFFFHMLVPLALALTLWLHLVRISRPRFLTRAPMTIWVLGSLLVLSIAYPAQNAEPARMTALSQSFGMDWWYLLPLALTDRLGGGALWSVLLVGGAVIGGVPWWMARRRPPAARVTPSRCNACMQCYQDCPYEAISMVPRTEGPSKYPVQAEVDPVRCVGCGICAGSCDSVGVGLDWFAVTDQRTRVEGWLEEAEANGESPNVAYVCSQSAGAGLDIDPDTGRCVELPGYRVLEVPCSGWLHTLTLERALRRGGREALVVTCGPGKCHYREGADWIGMRLNGERGPALRTDKVARERIHVRALDRTRKGDLVREALALQADGGEPAGAPRPRALAGVASVALALIVAAALGVVSDLGYAAPAVDGSQLAITFKHPGRVSEECRELTEEELARRPAHMRQEKICERARADVRLRVSVDGERRIDSTHPPTGIWGDGSSVAVVSLPIEPGEHTVRVEIGDSLDPEEWTHVTEQKLAFTEDARRVIVFDRRSGYTAY